MMNRGVGYSKHMIDLILSPDNDKLSRISVGIVVLYKHSESKMKLGD